MKIDELNLQTKDLNWQEKLEFIAKNFENLVFSTSFSIEDQVIFDFISKNKLNIEVFTLDTGRLPVETYKVWQDSLDKYFPKIKAYYPNAEKLEEYVLKNGIDAFYNSKELRLNCCGIRKIEPLKRALKGKEIWISGLRKEHSKDRSDREFFEEDESNNLIKFYPVLDLSEDEIWERIKENHIPYNELYEKGYKSIGCAPCSRSIGEGEDIRAGRWWWENDSHKECGLHVK